MGAMAPDVGRRRCKTPRRRTCAHMVVHELLAETQPEYRDRRLKVEEQTRNSINSGQAMRVTACLEDQGREQRAADGPQAVLNAETPPSAGLR